MANFSIGDLVYENPLSSETDVEDFRMEGDGAVSFPQERMRFSADGAAHRGRVSSSTSACTWAYPRPVPLSSLPLIDFEIARASGTPNASDATA